MRQPLLGDYVFSHFSMNNNELDRLYGGNSFIKSTMEPASNLERGCGTAEETGQVCWDKESLLGMSFKELKALGRGLR